MDRPEFRSKMIEMHSRNLQHQETNLLDLVSKIKVNRLEYVSKMMISQMICTWKYVGYVTKFVIHSHRLPLTDRSFRHHSRARWMSVHEQWSRQIDWAEEKFRKSTFCWVYLEAASSPISGGTRLDVSTLDSLTHPVPPEGGPGLNKVCPRSTRPTPP